MMDIIQAMVDLACLNRYDYLRISATVLIEINGLDKNNVYEAAILLIRN